MLPTLLLFAAFATRATARGGGCMATKDSWKCHSERAPCLSQPCGCPGGCRAVNTCGCCVPDGPHDVSTPSSSAHGPAAPARSPLLAAPAAPLSSEALLSVQPSARHRVSVSGQSAGGSMAVQHLFAFSSSVDGAAVAAGSPYG